MTFANLRPAAMVASEICGCAFFAQRKRNVAVIEADRAALVAEIVAGLREKAIIHRSKWGMSVDPRTEELAAYVEAKWGGK